MYTEFFFKTYDVSENNISVGKLEVNLDLISKEQFIRPFIRESEPKTLKEINGLNYAELDQFIINSLNDYYNRLMSAPETEKLNMLNTYHHLYDMWRDLHNYKISKNLKEIEKMYNIFSYELYVLGYIK